MTLQAVYKQFLAAPSSSALAQNASLHYITSTTSFHGPTDIIKHLSSQRNLIKKIKEDPITVVEGHDALAVQTDLSLEFIVNGGAYLPGLDDQFLSDRVVDLAVVSLVSGTYLLAPQVTQTVSRRPQTTTLRWLTLCLVAPHSFTL